nr:MAG TPA: hypothetical protein [Caudoviricetes sp.]
MIGSWPGRIIRNKQDRPKWLSKFLPFVAII